jgi:pimeloyl-ACP methyl ester carboxylesterase
MYLNFYTLRCYAFRILSAIALGLLILSFIEPARAQAPTNAQSLTNPNITAAPNRFSVLIQGPAASLTTQDILLIPGLASSREDYAAEATLLAPTYRLHLIQLAGFSGEPAGPNASGPILAPVVAQLHSYITTNKIHPAIIGHSLGGLLALMLAQAHPEDVSKLLIVDALPFYGLVFNPYATVEMVAPQAKAMADTMRAMPADQFAATSSMTAAMLVTDPAGLKIVQASSATSDRTVFLNAMLEDLGTDIRPTLATIKTATTVLYPYNAAQGPEANVTALYTNAYITLPNVKLIKIDNSRHFIMFDQPAAFHTAVETFLK